MRTFRVLLILLLIGCGGYQLFCGDTSRQPDTGKIDALVATLKDATSRTVLVAAHRGDWRNAPENSLPAIQSAIAMGVDIVEIDIQKTSDGQLVLMHDPTIDRTTSGSGPVSAWTLDSLRKHVVLMNAIGRKTVYPVPTLREAMLVAKGNVLVNLDKCYAYFDEAYRILEETGTTRQVILKGYNKTAAQVTRDLGQYLDKIHFMPIINCDKSNAPQVLEDFLTLHPVAAEFVFSNDAAALIPRFQQYKEDAHIRIWVNSLWASLNAGHTDTRAFHGEEDQSYGWILEKGANIIQTDRPALLLSYLRKKALHP